MKTESLRVTSIQAIHPKWYWLSVYISDISEEPAVTFLDIVGDRNDKGLSIVKGHYIGSVEDIMQNGGKIKYKDFKLLNISVQLTEDELNWIKLASKKIMEIAHWNEAIDIIN